MHALRNNPNFAFIGNRRDCHHCCFRQLWLAEVTAPVAARRPIFITRGCCRVSELTIYSFRANVMLVVRMSNHGWIVLAPDLEAPQIMRARRCRRGDFSRTSSLLEHHDDKARLYPDRQRQSARLPVLSRGGSIRTAEVCVTNLTDQANGQGIMRA